MELETTIANGLPCIAKVVTYNVIPPDRNADSDWDSRGYTEIDFDLLTRKGKTAAWMDKLMSEADRQRIEIEIEKEMR